MGVGPARFGLKPGIGRKPGIDPARAHVELRTIEYPSETDYPGRGLRTILRWATVPSSTLYPAENRYLRGAPEVFSRTITLLGNGLASVTTHPFRRFRRITFESTEAVLRVSGIRRGPSFLRGKLPTTVEFSHPHLSVDFEALLEPIEFESVHERVEL